MRLFRTSYISISLSSPLPPLETAGRIGVIAVLHVNVRCDPRKNSLHWQHPAKDLSLDNSAMVFDGMDAE